MIRVLIVDDDKLVRKGLASSMPWAEFGMEVVGEANNGENALAFMETHNVDLLMTDLSMPVMSGIELMRIVRVKHPHVHIVVLSLHQDFEYVQEALRLGAIDYIAKVQLEKEQFEDVLGRVVALIEQKGGAKEAVLPEKSEQPRDGQSQLLRAYGKDDVFYDDNSDQSVIAVQAANQPKRDKQGGSAPIERIKSEWGMADWLYEDGVFERQLEELKELRLPPVRLSRIFFSLSDEWNRLYKSILPEPIAIDDFFPSWHRFEEWLREVRERIAQANAKPQFSPEIQASILKAIALAQQHIHEPISSADIAQMVNMSGSYFSQCFKQYAGKTYTDYVRDIRMERAKQYLRTTNRTIQWVAEQIGYNDEKYFSRLFREHTGLLPSEFRQQQGHNRMN